MSINDQLNLQEEYRISAEEVFFLQLIFLAQPEENKSEYLHKYFHLQEKSKPREMLIHLQSVGIINKAYKIPNIGESFDPTNIDFNKNFFRKYLSYSNVLGMEFWEKYPNLLTIKGGFYTAKNIAKKFNSIEDFFFAYGKAIKFNPDKHKEVLEILEWGKQNSLIKSGICEFVISRQFETLKQLKDDGFDGNMLEIDELL